MEAKIEKNGNTHLINPPMVNSMSDLFSPKMVLDKKYPSLPQNLGLSRT